MVQDIRIVAIVLVGAALIYLLYLWSKRRDQIPCPSCGARVNIYADECPHCGHQKGEKVEDEQAENDDSERLEEEPVGSEDDDTPDTAGDDGSEDDDAVDYDEVVKGTIPEVKHEVMENDLDLEEVLVAEKNNKDRVTLKDWIEDQLPQH